MTAETVTPNPKTTSGMDELLGTFSLNNAQLYVGLVNDDAGNAHKAINIVDASYEDGAYVGLYIFDAEYADRLVSFLSSAIGGNLPVSFEFPPLPSKFFGPIQTSWDILAFDSEWHHGGGYKGKLDNLGGYIITRQAAEKLRECVSELFLEGSSGLQ